MSDNDQELSLGDEDRLPWLEAVESDDEEPKVDTGKIVGFVVAALLALGIVVAVQRKQARALRPQQHYAGPTQLGPQRWHCR